MCLVNVVNVTNLLTLLDMFGKSKQSLIIAEADQKKFDMALLLTQSQAAACPKPLSQLDGHLAFTPAHHDVTPHNCTLIHTTRHMLRAFHHGLIVLIRAHSTPAQHDVDTPYNDFHTWTSSVISHNASELQSLCASPHGVLLAHSPQVPGTTVTHKRVRLNCPRSLLQAGHRTLWSCLESWQH